MNIKSQLKSLYQYENDDKFSIKLIKSHLIEKDNKKIELLTSQNIIDCFKIKHEDIPDDIKLSAQEVYTIQKYQKEILFRIFISLSLTFDLKQDKNDFRSIEHNIKLSQQSLTDKLFYNDVYNYLINNKNNFLKENLESYIQNNKNPLILNYCLNNDFLNAEWSTLLEHKFGLKNNPNPLSSRSVYLLNETDVLSYLPKNIFFTNEKNNDLLKISKLCGTEINTRNNFNDENNLFTLINSFIFSSQNGYMNLGHVCLNQNDIKTVVFKNPSSILNWKTFETKQIDNPIIKNNIIVTTPSKIKSYVTNKKSLQMKLF